MSRKKYRLSSYFPSGNILLIQPYKVFKVIKYYVPFFRFTPKILSFKIAMFGRPGGRLAPCEHRASSEVYLLANLFSK